MLADRRAWRLLSDGGLSGAENMARDEALALCADRSPYFTLRMYNFLPPAVTIGRFQPVSGQIDPARLESLGMDIVRRPTGGLAIPHVNDFTYSVVMSAEETGAKARDGLFRIVADCIIEALRVLGITVRVGRHKVTKDHGESWCFESVYGVDLEWSGRKICGSAQRVFRRSILQHGTLILDRGSELDEYRARFVTLMEAGGREYTWEEVRTSFAKGFEKTLETDMMPGEMTAEEKSLTEVLVRNKYSRTNWLMLESTPRVFRGL